MSKSKAYKAALKAFERNKRLVDSGTKFRGYQVPKRRHAKGSRWS